MMSLAPLISAARPVGFQNSLSYSFSYADMFIDLIGSIHARSKALLPYATFLGEVHQAFSIHRVDIGPPN
jgi:hypothetical protein